MSPPPHLSSSVWTSLAARPGIVLLTIALVACGAAPEAAAPPSEPPEVSIVVVTPGPMVIDDVLPGRVAPVRIAEVRPLVSGIVLARLFEEGATVEEGTPLYRIDSSAFRAEVAGAHATAARQRVALELATREAERASRLAATGATASSTAETAESARAVAEADLAISEAALRRSRLSLHYTTVVAPIAGRIGISSVHEGALVSPTDPTGLVTIQQIDEVYVDIRQPVGRWDEIRAAIERGEIERDEATPLAVTLLSLRGEPYTTEGRLLFTDINVDPSTTELTMRVLVPNSGARLLPGMLVRARVTFGTDPDALLLPQQAVRHDAALGASVLVVDAEDHVAVRTVETGPIVDGQQEIRAGLSAGDRVIVEGLDALAPGTAVRPVPWSAD